MITEDIKQLIAKGELKEALEASINFYSDKDRRLHDNLLLLSSRLREYEDNKNKGILDYKDEERSLNKLKSDFLDILNNKITINPKNSHIDIRKKKIKSRSILIILAYILLIGAIFVISKFKNESDYKNESNYISKIHFNITPLEDSIKLIYTDNNIARMDTFFISQNFIVKNLTNALVAHYQLEDNLYRKEGVVKVNAWEIFANNQQIKEDFLPINESGIVNNDVIRIKCFYFKEGKMSPSPNSKPSRFSLLFIIIGILCSILIGYIVYKFMKKN